MDGWHSSAFSALTNKVLGSERCSQCTIFNSDHVFLTKESLDPTFDISFFVFFSRGHINNIPVGTDENSSTEFSQKPNTSKHQH